MPVIPVNAAAISQTRIISSRSDRESIKGILAWLYFYVATNLIESRSDLELMTRVWLIAAAVTGITGTREALPDGLIKRITWLRTQTDLPICVGFGISTPEQVRALSGVADGVIVGSAIVKHIAAAADTPAQTLKNIRSFVASMISAC